MGRIYFAATLLAALSVTTFALDACAQGTRQRPKMVQTDHLQPVRFHTSPLHVQIVDESPIVTLPREQEPEVIYTIGKTPIIDGALVQLPMAAPAGARIVPLTPGRSNPMVRTRHLPVSQFESNLHPGNPQLSNLPPATSTAGLGKVAGTLKPLKLSSGQPAAANLSAGEPATQPAAILAQQPRQSVGSHTDGASSAQARVKAKLLRDLQ